VFTLIQEILAEAGESGIFRPVGNTQVDFPTHQKRTENGGIAAKLEHKTFICQRNSTYRLTFVSELPTSGNGVMPGMLYLLFL